MPYWGPLLILLLALKRWGPPPPSGRRYVDTRPTCGPLLILSPGLKCGDPRGGRRYVATIPLVGQGVGVSENSDSVGGFEKPPLFLKMVCGGVLRVFFDADTPILRIFFLLVLFWTAHPKFCPCPQFSHF